MLISTCQTLWMTLAVGLVASFTIYSVDFSKVFSYLLDFKFEPIRLDLVKMCSIPATCLLIGFLIVGEAQIGESSIKITECKSKSSDSKVSCASCSISNTIALK